MGNFIVKAEKIKKITLLGDSITEGYGLSEEELNYGDYLEKYFDAQVDNFAVSGLTTEGQLEKLNEPEIVESIKEADIICFSIGGNDLIDIIENALGNGGEGEIALGEGSFNISPEFIENFIMNYTSAFGSAVVAAGSNIEEITDKLKELNPGAEIIIHTIYVPFESSKEEWNAILKPLKIFSSMYIGNINNSIKETAPNIADINMKFSEKPYLYTNMDNYDFHPNYLGHMLIAEEIIQTLDMTGDYSVFKNVIDEIPHGVYSELPVYTANELDEFANGQMRRGSLEQSIERYAEAFTETSENTELTENTVNTEASEQKKQTETADKINDKASNKKSVISKICLIIGVSIILFITAYRYIKKRRKR